MTRGPGIVSGEIGAVEVRGVSKTFPALEGSDIRALDQISPRVRQGEFLGSSRAFSGRSAASWSPARPGWAPSSRR